MPYTLFGILHSPDVKQLAHTIAHELGHGLFTLQHTFDDEYGGDNSRSNTANIMDYGTGNELVAFQWNIMSKPAVFTALDKADEIQLEEDTKVLSGLFAEMCRRGSDYVIFAVEGFGRNIDNTDSFIREIQEDDFLTIYLK